MPYSIVVAEDAIDDIDRAVEYYNGISYGLGFEFTDTLDLYFKKIATLPTASATRYDSVRVKALDTFPFTIHFIIADDATVIIRTRHRSCRCFSLPSC